MNKKILIYSVIALGAWYLWKKSRPAIAVNSVTVDSIDARYSAELAPDAAGTAANYVSSLFSVNAPDLTLNPQMIPPSLIMN